MVLFPSGGLGRLLLVVIIITTISYFVLNLVSFGGNRWITYVDVPVRFGLWRVCDTTGPGLCNYWSDQFVSNLSNVTFGGSKPGFVRDSQALEIISLIFYILAAGLIIIGIVDLDTFPFEIAFMVAAGLLFICIIFISASLGVMSDQGRDNHPLAFLDWAWWNGLVGLIMTIICCFSLLALIAYMRYSPSSGTSPKAQRDSSKGPIWSRSPSPSAKAAGSFTPIVPANSFINPPLNNYSLANPPLNNYSLANPPLNNYSLANPPLNNYSLENPPLNNYSLENPPLNNYSSPNEYFQQNPLMSYGGQNVSMPSANQYFNEQNPAPVISELARQYVLRISDTQYQRQLLEPYRQYLRDPYLINNYL